MSVIHATFLDGVLRPDEPLPLPDGSRVRIQVETVSPASPMEKTPFQEFLEYSHRHPVYSGGEKFNREELYDRG